MLELVWEWKQWVNGYKNRLSLHAICLVAPLVPGVETFAGRTADATGCGEAGLAVCHCTVSGHSAVKCHAGKVMASVSMYQPVGCSCCTFRFFTTYCWVHITQFKSKGIHQPWKCSVLTSETLCPMSPSSHDFSVKQTPAWHLLHNYEYNFIGKND